MEERARVRSFFWSLPEWVAAARMNTNYRGGEKNARAGRNWAQNDEIQYADMAFLGRHICSIAFLATVCDNPSFIFFLNDD